MNQVPVLPVMHTLLYPPVPACTGRARAQAIHKPNSCNVHALRVSPYVCCVCPGLWAARASVFYIHINHIHKQAYPLAVWALECTHNRNRTVYTRRSCLQITRYIRTQWALGMRAPSGAVLIMIYGWRAQGPTEWMG